MRDFTQDRDALLSVLNKHSGDVVWRYDSNGRTGEQASQNVADSSVPSSASPRPCAAFPAQNVLWVGDGFPPVNMSDVGRTTANEISTNLRHLSSVMLHARVTLSIAGPTLKGHQPVTIETQSDSDMMSSGGYDGLNISQGGIAFSGLAPPTGGRAYQNRNDLDGEIADVAAGSSYYTLSYRPTNPSKNDPKAYRRIRSRSPAPGLTVQTRDGYFAEPQQPVPPAKIHTQQLAFDLNGAAIRPPRLHRPAPYSRAWQPRQLYPPTPPRATSPGTDLPKRPPPRRFVLLAACLLPPRPAACPELRHAGLQHRSLARLHRHLVRRTAHARRRAAGTARIRFVARDLTSGSVGTVASHPRIIAEWNLRRLLLPRSLDGAHHGAGLVGALDELVLWHRIRDQPAPA